MSDDDDWDFAGADDVVPQVAAGCRPSSLILWMAVCLADSPAPTLGTPLASPGFGLLCAGRSAPRMARQPGAACRGEERKEMRTLENAICGGCRAPLRFDEPCPACGSTVRCFSQSSHITSTTNVSLRARQKRSGLPGWLVDMFVGKQPRKGPGGVIIGWVDKLRRIDKAANRYVEHVVTESGQVLRDIDEPLRAHQGHGSDRADIKSARVERSASRQMSDTGTQAAFILDNAERVITLATRCVFSFGSADGLNDLLLNPDDQAGDWRQPVAVLHRDALMMAALRTCILLDRDEQMVSFQAVHRRLKEPDVVASLLQALEERKGFDSLPPSRTELIEEFRQTYGEIDWKVHGRLTHFRNRGITHLTPEEMTTSVTMAELRTLIQIVSRLTATMQHLCQTQTAFRADLLAEYRDRAKRTINRPG